MWGGWKELSSPWVLSSVAEAEWVRGGVVKGGAYGAHKLSDGTTGVIFLL